MSKLPPAAFIAHELAETDATAKEQITGIVNALGEDEALALLEEALEIQAAGGLRIANGLRKRSPGGVFFHLARQVLSREAKQRIFYGKHDAGTHQAEAPGANGAKESATTVRLRRRVVDVTPDLIPSKTRAKAFPVPTAPVQRRHGKVGRG